MSVSICYLYWIHLKWHTDITKEGYIGVTSKTPEERFKQHVIKSKNSEGYIISRAIRKHGEDKLILSTLLLGEETYVYDIEEKLRPDKSIGWNTAIGGRASKVAVKFSEDVIQRLLTSYYLHKKPILNISKTLGISDTHVRGILAKRYRKNFVEAFLEKYNIPASGEYKPAEFNFVSDEDVYKMMVCYYVKGYSLSSMVVKFNIDEKSIRHLMNNKPVVYASLERDFDNVIRVPITTIPLAKEQLVCSLYIEGKELKFISNETGVSSSSIDVILNKNGVTKRAKTYTDSKLIYALRLHMVDGLTQKETERITGVSRRYIGMLKNGKIKPRIAGEITKLLSA